jgi:hypothetical protein
MEKGSAPVAEPATRNADAGIPTSQSFRCSMCARCDTSASLLVSVARRFADEPARELDQERPLFSVFVDSV